MGDVYAAFDPDLDRKIAIKLLRRSETDAGNASTAARSNADTDRGAERSQTPARLLREAQVIAHIAHPNVVVIYDVGTFRRRVFLAMEFIEGHNLRYWLETKPRGMAEVLQVFLAAGRGLAAAHDRGIVHRDFKPDNVMVGAAGQVRVMDFGLARLGTSSHDVRASEIAVSGPRGGMAAGNPVDDGAGRPVPSGQVSSIVAPYDDLDSKLDAGAPAEVDVASPLASASTAWLKDGARRPETLTVSLTQEGTIVGTPAYMAPEQFRGWPTDARADQFSFCVALYEALSGVRPFAGSTLEALTGNVVAGRLRPESHGTRLPAAIRRTLSRGLRLDAGARFPSMHALLAELEQEPNLLGTRGFAGDAAAKLAGIWEANAQENGASNRVSDAVADAVETAAKSEIRRAFLATGKPYAAVSFEAVSRILDRFAQRWTELYVDCCEATHLRGEQTTEILDLRMGALREALADLRALCQALRHATSDTVENAVHAASALGTLERCADVNLLRAIVRPPDNPVTRACLGDLQARLANVRALAHLGRVAAGLKEVVALEIDARRLGYTPLLAEVLFMSGVLHYDSSDIDTAARVLQDAVWTAEMCRHDEVAAEAATNLVFVTGHVQTHFEVGEIWSRHADTVLRRMGGHDVVRGWLLQNRGAMRAAQGRLREALDDTYGAIAAKEKALGPQDPDVALSLTNAGIYLEELGEIARATECAERAIDIMESTLGFDHPKAAIPLTNYAELLNRLGRFDDARRPAERALAVFERETDPEGLYVTYPLSALGLSYIALGRFADALPPLERAVRIRDARENVPARRAEVHFALARALEGAAGHYSDRALALATRARDEYQQSPATPAAERELAAIDRWLTAALDPARPGRPSVTAPG